MCSHDHTPLRKIQVAQKQKNLQNRITEARAGRNIKQNLLIENFNVRNSNVHSIQIIKTRFHTKSRQNVRLNQKAPQKQ